MLEYRKCIILPGSWFGQFWKHPTLCGNFWHNEAIYMINFLHPGYKNAIQEVRTFDKKILLCLFLIRWLVCSVLLSYFSNFKTFLLFHSNPPRISDPIIPKQSGLWINQPITITSSMVILLKISSWFTKFNQQSKYANYFFFFTIW